MSPTWTNSRWSAELLNRQRARSLVSYSASAADTSKRELEPERRTNLEIIKVPIFQKRGGRVDGRGQEEGRRATTLALKVHGCGGVGQDKQ